MSNPNDQPGLGPVPGQTAAKIAAAAPPAHQPYIPDSTVLPEITVGTVALSIVLSVILGAANAYLGMFAGMTVSASIPAAVLSMAILSAFGGNILQNNSVQTAASAGESLAAGVIFTLPALIIMGRWANFHYLETTLIAGFGGLLGVLFTIPLRRALIVEQPLQFPEGVATAEVLKSGDSGGGGVKAIAVAGLIGALFKLLVTGVKLSKESAVAAANAGGSIFYIGSSLSPALIGVGFIVRLNIAALIFLGGAINWLVAIPLYSAIAGAPEGSAEEAAFAIWSSDTRYLGVGAMLVGGLWALIRLRKPLITGIRGGLQAYSGNKASSAALPRSEQDTSMKLVIGLAAASLVPLFFLFEHFTHDIGIAAFMAVFMLIAGFLFSAVAAYMAGLVGSSNNPISGITIATILTSALLLLAMRVDSEVGPVAAILIGGVVCCAAALGGDNMQDLKAGHIIGSTPKKLQIMQVIGVLAAAFTLGPVLNVMHSSYEIGSVDLPAPQAGLMAAVARGVFHGGLPWGIVAIGAAIAVAVIILDVALEARGARFRTPVLALAVGIYLPFELSVPIFLGGLLAYLVDRHNARFDEDTRTLRDRNGLLFAAGLITGEALLGIAIAVPIAATHDSDVLALFGVHNGSPLPGMVVLAAVMYLIYRSGTRSSQ